MLSTPPCQWWPVAWIAIAIPIIETETWSVSDFQSTKHPQFSLHSMFLGSGMVVSSLGSPHRPPFWGTLQLRSHLVAQGSLSPSRCGDVISESMYPGRKNWKLTRNWIVMGLNKAKQSTWPWHCMRFIKYLGFPAKEVLSSFGKKEKTQKDPFLSLKIAILIGVKGAIQPCKLVHDGKWEHETSFRD